MIPIIDSTKASQRELEGLDLQTFRLKHPKMSYAKIAHRLGVDINTVKSWGCGRRTQTERTKRELAKLHLELISGTHSQDSRRSLKPKV
ncbi:hypothetical protein H6G97_20960 [Nostoc flagelliforme FACHB-838]|uniref:Transposase n=2 Tax=Nostoc flagelliforme TaxID=1306274 RepID=A0ABR8DR84_9NOSO|nr:hypothetical protein [Nostoc flagelliforme FACHB-838]